MSEFIKDHPEAAYLIITGLGAWALRSLRSLIKTETAAGIAGVLKAIDIRGYATRADMDALGARLDRHLERCHGYRPTRRKKP